MRKSKKKLSLEKIFFIVYLIYIAVIFIVLIFKKDVLLISIMPWNVFLGILPLIFSNLFRKCMEKGKNVLSIITGTTWLLLFPNSPYVLTDFIHLYRITFYSNKIIGSGKYIREASGWFSLVIIGCGVFLALTAGLYSLYVVHKSIKKKNNSGLFGWISILGVSILSGYGIYLGRIIRLNSWDILEPLNLIKRIYESIDSFSILFSIMFAIYIMFTYFIFYTILEREKDT